jgi:hypothetical protein
LHNHIRSPTIANLREKWRHNHNFHRLIRASSSPQGDPCFHSFLGNQNSMQLAK